MYKRNETLKYRCIYIGFFSLLFGLAFGLINIVYLFDILDYCKLNVLVAILNENSSFFICLMMILSLYSIIYFYFVKDFNQIKRKWSGILHVIGILGFTICFLIFITGSIIELTATVENKTSYETLLIANKQKVVLTIYDNDKYVIADYVIDNNGNATFFTDYYMIVPIESNSVMFVNFTSVKISN